MKRRKKLSKNEILTLTEDFYMERPGNLLAMLYNFNLLRPIMFQYNNYCKLE